VIVLAGNRQPATGNRQPATGNRRAAAETITLAGQRFGALVGDANVVFQQIVLSFAGKSTLRRASFVAAASLLS